MWGLFTAQEPMIGEELLAISSSSTNLMTEAGVHSRNYNLHWVKNRTGSYVTINYLVRKLPLTIVIRVNR